MNQIRIEISDDYNDLTIEWDSGDTSLEVRAQLMAAYCAMKDADDEVRYATVQLQSETTH